MCVCMRVSGNYARKNSVTPHLIKCAKICFYFSSSKCNHGLPLQSRAAFTDNNKMNKCVSIYKYILYATKKKLMV